MRGALRWQLYVAAYTFLFGAPLLICPNQVIPLLGFSVTEEPWVRLVGMFLLSLAYISIVIYKKKAADFVVIHSIVIRIGFIMVLLTLALSGHPPFLYAMAGIVAIGVVGSTVSYIIENRDRPA